MRLPVYGKPRIISCAEDLPKHLAFPRGCLEEITALLRAVHIQPVIRDERFASGQLALTQPIWAPPVIVKGSCMDTKGLFERLLWRTRVARDVGGRALAP